MAKLIVGLGNPGLKYAKTRHNLGFMVVKAFAKKQGWSFKKERLFQGEIAHGEYGEEKIHLLLPTTYMNLSGSSVRKAVDNYEISFEDTLSFLVVVDDVHTKFGKMRLRPKGGTGGHKGLLSLEQHLKSQDYPRLRMGVGPRDLPEEAEIVLERFVLSKFTSTECQQLPELIDRGVAIIETWMDQGIEQAMLRAGEIT